MNKFKVTFKENKKYKPVTRTVGIETSGGFVSAVRMINSEFGRSKITITSVLDENNKEYLEVKPTQENNLENEANKDG